MIGRALRIGALVFVTIGLVTACSSSDRPRELSMEDVKACQLVSQHDLQQLQVKAAPRPVPGVAGVNVDGTGCLYLPLARNDVTISKVANHGIDRWTGFFNDVTVEHVAPIRGFPTIKVGDENEPIGSEDPNECTLYVDVADDRLLRVQVEGSYRKNAPPTCDTARRFGQAAMETLIRDG